MVVYEDSNIVLEDLQRRNQRAPNNAVARTVSGSRKTVSQSACDSSERTVLLVRIGMLRYTCRMDCVVSMV